MLGARRRCGQELRGRDAAAAELYRMRGESVPSRSSVLRLLGSKRARGAGGGARADKFIFEKGAAGAERAGRRRGRGKDLLDDDHLADFWGGEWKKPASNGARGRPQFRTQAQRREPAAVRLAVLLLGTSGEGAPRTIHHRARKRNWSQEREIGQGGQDARHRAGGGGSDRDGTAVLDAVDSSARLGPYKRRWRAGSFKRYRQLHDTTPLLR